MIHSRATIANLTLLWVNMISSCCAAFPLHSSYRSRRRHRLSHMTFPPPPGPGGAASSTWFSLSSLSSQFVIADAHRQVQGGPDFFTLDIDSHYYSTQNISWILSGDSISILRSLVNYSSLSVSRHRPQENVAPPFFAVGPRQFPLSFACPGLERHWLISPCPVAVSAPSEPFALVISKTQEKKI